MQTTETTRCIYSIKSQEIPLFSVLHVSHNNKVKLSIVKFLQLAFEFVPGSICPIFKDRIDRAEGLIDLSRLLILMPSSLS